MTNEEYSVPLIRDAHSNGGKRTPKVYIKIVGVGGGGCNAVAQMYQAGIKDVNFLVCNTDEQQLESSIVPDKLLLGDEGLGAGNIPAVGREKAEESLERIKEAFDDGCRMAFITCGMGGGTGTGAAPVIARVAKDMGLLTVGIVTIPFVLEGEKRIDQALAGVEEISKSVDALIVINNERLRDVYPDLSAKNSLAKANETLLMSTKGIAELITLEGFMNLDFNDVKTTLENGGIAIIGMGYGKGENRVKTAIENALNSPLISHTSVYNSKKLLVVINSPTEGEVFMMEEMSAVHEFTGKFSREVLTKIGLYDDETLKDEVRVTILAAGFELKDVPGMERVLTDEEKKERARQEEEEQRRAEVRKVYYGDAFGKSKKKTYNYYIFNGEDLDNDDVISLVDSSPTYQRSKTMLESIKQKAVTMMVTTEEKASTTENGVITF